MVDNDRGQSLISKYVWDMFYIDIVNEGRGEYRYYISNGEDVEVLAPQWLRKDIAGKVKRMWNKYAKEQ